MKKFLFADLDDTLFQSLEKCAAQSLPEPAAFLRDGSPISYTSAAQRSLLALLNDGMTVIPATARNQDAYRRVRVPFSSYAVLDYGGMVLLPDGSIDAYWRDRMAAAMHAALPGLQQLAVLLDAHAQQAGLACRARLIEDGGLPFYLVLKDADKVAARLEPFERDVVLPWLAERGGEGGYYLHRNGNNLAVMPRALNKAHAVSYVTQLLRQEHGDILTFGMGDSRVDARFMAGCDYAIVPRGTQLAGLTMEGL